ncbi:hypothetical protein ACLDYC_08370 [Acinetobacter baumannii]
MLDQSKEIKVCTYLGLTTLILSVTLVGCGGGSSSGGSSNPPKPSEPTPEVMTDITLKTPVEMRNVQLKVYDNTDNSILIDTQVASLTSYDIKLPSTKLNRLYRVEITTQNSSLVFNPITSKYQNLSGIYHTFITPNTVSSRTQFISPSSEAIYQRAMVRSGQLPNETIIPTRIEQLHVDLASQDVYRSLLNAFKDVDIPSLSPANLLVDLTRLQYSTTKPSTYVDSYLSFGYLQYWSSIHNTNSPYQDLTPNLRAATFKLADLQDQSHLDPIGYDLLNKKQYSGIIPAGNTSEFFRIDGAGDYRRAVGFSGITATCNGSAYPCKQGLTSINISDPKLPATDYLVGHYEDNATGCQLNFRANGQIELIKGSQSYRSALSADSTDNLLQTDAASYSYLLNSSSSEPNNSTQQYNFIQLHIKANKIVSAQAGLDSRKAPDVLQTTQ